MVDTASSYRINEISSALDHALTREWVFPACARYGELLTAIQLDPRTAVSCNEVEIRIRELISAHQDALTSAWAEECKHVVQMVRSGYGLVFEELVALLTSLSELSFVKNCLSSLRINDVSLTETFSTRELREFLSSQRNVYPSGWSLPHTTVLDCDEHWWWNRK
jgi:hypothetical protein